MLPVRGAFFCCLFRNGRFVSELDMGLLFRAIGLFLVTGVFISLGIRSRGGMAMILFIRISAAALSVYMFKQFILYCCAERVKNEVNSFTACQLRRRDEIAISGNQHDLIHLLFIGQRRDINADLHIHTFLLDIWRKIPFFQICNLNFPCAEFLQYIILNIVFGIVIVEDAKAKSDLSFLL